MFIRVLVGSLRRLMGSLDSFGCASVNLGASRGSPVHSGSRGFNFCASNGRQVHSGTHGFTRAPLVIVEGH